MMIRLAPRGAKRSLVMRVGAALALILAYRPVVAQPIPPRGDDRAMAEFLQPTPPKEPAEALATLETLDGFRVDLVASEPLVTDPVAGAFDEDGRLYIAELADYPYRSPEGEPPLGRVRLLLDTDGDGIFDASHVFADELMWPTGVAAWKQGVFVAATPDIWYLKDTDGDGRADVRRKVFTGFGVEKAQGSLNNLIWSIDHKIYGAGSANGGQVRPAGAADAPAVVVDGKDFRFEPNSLAFEAVSGGAQFGNTFDDAYNRFLSSQGTPAYHVVLPDEYLARNAHLALTGAVKNLHPEPTPIFRVSELERWRIIRSTRRIETGYRAAESVGVSQHVLDAGAGATVYRGTAYPEGFYGNLFVGCSLTNLVHRMRLIPDSATFRVERADEATEFLRSTDNWFRPVNFLNAPDGTLYVLDMYREFIEAVHIPFDVVKHLDLTHGRDRGRIYRVAPDGFQLPPPPRLSEATTEGLVGLLEHDGSWWRETAHRLIYERQDAAAVAPLRAVLRGSAKPQARLAAMWSLDGLSALTDDDLLAALDDSASFVREHAVRLAEPRLASSRALVARVLQAADDDAIRVRFQTAFTLGQMDDARSVAALAKIAARDSGDPWIRAAVLSSTADSSHELLAELARGEAVASPALVRSLAEVVGVRGRQEEIKTALTAALSAPAAGADALRDVVEGMAVGLDRNGQRFDSLSFAVPKKLARAVQSVFDDAAATASEPSAGEGRQTAAVRLLTYAPRDQALPILASLLSGQELPAIRSAAAVALSSFDDPDACQALLAAWPQATPSLRQLFLSSITRRRQWYPLLLDAVERQVVLPSEIDSSRRELLLARLDADERARAERLLQPPSPRADVLSSYQPCLDLDGDRAAGEQVFKRECAVCHRLGAEGHDLGPNLALSKNKTRDELLTHILDPNREGEPSFLQYTLVDRQGRIFTGLIAAETATAVTLARAENQRDTILRADVEELVNSGKSLMPEGFEQKIDQQQMADLLAFLLNIQYDLGTAAGLTEDPKTRRSPESDVDQAGRAGADKQPVNPADEAMIFTPPGFAAPGQAAKADDAEAGLLEVVVRDRSTGRPTPCRVNVVGADGNFYQPDDNPLGTYSMLANWPSPGRHGDPNNRPASGYGNRPGKAPIRYFGHFFYTRGSFTVRAPAGNVRVEVWKGIEYAPSVAEAAVLAGETAKLEVTIDRAVDMAAAGYHSGDTHLHLFRTTEADEQTAFDLLEAEDVRHGGLLTYNYNTSRYVGRTAALEYPPRLALGLRSIAARSDQRIISGQEYRSGQYGHMNLFLTDGIVLENTTLDPNTWPVYGLIGHRVRALGGYAFHAHGGYGKEIWADCVTGAAQGVELLQFGVYRGIELEGWYHILNCGFRFAAHGASDYPACRMFSDCRTYVHSEQPLDFAGWLNGVADGRSFFTTGPLLLLTVDDQPPGTLLRREGSGPHTLKVRVRLRSEVAPVTHLELIVNGRRVVEQIVPEAARQGAWHQVEHELSLTESSWIAARAWSLSATGSPDAESHTNPVYMYLDDRAPYRRESLDFVLAKVDEQIAAHAERQFDRQADVLAYFDGARRRLVEIREHSGQPAPAETNALHDARGRETAEILPQLNLLLERYRDGDEWRKRIEDVRRGVLAHMRLWPAPKRRPLRAIVHSPREHDGYSVENVALETLDGFYCTGNLYRPLGRSGPFPAVLCPHGHFRPLGRFREEQQIRCAHLARMGAVVFSYSMVGWQDSQQTSHYDDPNVIALQTWNSTRVVDFLTSLPGVDGSRIAATGASGGGSQSIYAALADERICAVAPVVIVYPWSTACNCESGMSVMTDPVTSAIELTACLAPRPNLIISCGYSTPARPRPDRTHNFAYTGLPFIQEVYSRLGAADEVRHLHLADEAHDFGPSKRKAVYAFLAEELGLDDLPEDTSGITLETPEAMQVFDADHPLPPHAARNTEEVTEAFERLVKSAR